MDMDTSSSVVIPEFPPMSPSPRRFPRVLIVVGGALILALVLLWGIMRAQKQAKDPPPEVPPVPSYEQGVAGAPQPPPPPPSDSDGDRLSNEEEVALGTNPFHPDSDGDELFDAAEVRIYKTDPKNLDTDGDGHKDGAEVRAGYNPAGPGKL